MCVTAAVDGSRKKQWAKRHRIPATEFDAPIWNEAYVVPIKCPRFVSVAFVVACIAWPWCNHVMHAWNCQVQEEHQVTRCWTRRPAFPLRAHIALCIIHVGENVCCSPHVNAKMDGGLEIRQSSHTIASKAWQRWMCDGKGGQNVTKTKE